jgi:hypothetical protein
MTRDQFFDKLTEVGLMVDHDKDVETLYEATVEFACVTAMSTQSGREPDRALEIFIADMREFFKKNRVYFQTARTLARHHAHEATTH